MTTKMKKAAIAAIVAALAVYGVTVSEDAQDVILDLLEVETTE